ncbi:MAG: zinc carboxypeptidase [Cyclobacteriaceae bacterium]
MKKLLVILLFLGLEKVNAQLLSPHEFLGYQLGDKFTQHYRVVDYFEHVDAESSLVKLELYGKTYEGRPLLLAQIASEENLRRLETIRKDNLKRAGILEGTPETAVSIVWMSYNVHGNESSSTEAAMLTMYKLLTENKDWLEDIVVIIDPCVNPDGRERYVNFYNPIAQMPFNPDVQASEHQELWPGGRFNHYLFDLNRDWAWQTQLESQQRLSEFNKWMPQVHVDFHEMRHNNPYYFAPAAKPYHELITDWQIDFQTKLGRNHAKYFDENNWFYFTKEKFDLLYPSYGDTYPTYNGAIGMTYEQGGHSRAGLGVIKNEGDTLTLLDRLTHHTTTGLSTIEISAELNEKLLSEFKSFFDQPVEGVYKTFVLKSENDDKMNDLKLWLDRNKIKYGSTSETKKLNGFNYQSRRDESFSISSKDLVVSVDQPKGILAKILFEPQTKYSDSLTYDLTAWAVPYFYGMQAYATSTVIKVNEQTLSVDFQPSEVPEKAYSFFFKWNSFNDAKLLAKFLNEKIKARFTKERLTLNGKSFEPGTIIIAKRDNSKLGDKFESRVTEISNTFKKKFEIVKTGFMDGGPDLGSQKVSYIKKPKIAVLRGNGVVPMDYGETWFYLEQELKYPYSAINTSSINSIDLSKYDILIMPNGNYRDFKKPQLDNISNWVRAGGRLIVTGNGITKFADSEYSSVSKFNSEEEKKAFKKKEDEKKEEVKLLPYDKGRREGLKRSVAGAIFKITLDNTHPLAYGYGNTLYSLKRSSNRFGYLKSQNVGVIKSKEDHMSGFAGQYVKEAVGKSMVFGVENKGKGKIIFLVDNPLFRAFWYDSKLMMANALFLVGQK